jgi:nitroreductase
MDFVKLNKSRHAVKHFDGKKIPTVEVKQIISAASLAPSAHNMQTWHFVIVASDEKRKALLEVVHPGNHEQIIQAGAVILLFSDTNLVERSHEIAQYGAAELNDDQLDRFNSRYPSLFEKYDTLYLSNYLSLNIGLVTMNLMYTIYNHGFVGNIVQGFAKSPRVNEILEVDARYRPELIIPFGTSEETGKPSFRLPQERIVEIR